MPHLLIFGPGYSAGAIGQTLANQGWTVTGVRRVAGAGAIGFDDGASVRAALAAATHLLSSVPPDGDADPVLARYGPAIAAAPLGWAGYLSSTGVYGDTGGAWVDETAPIGSGRRGARAAADIAWQALRRDVRLFRLPGIYGPGRSPLDRLRDGRAHRVDLPGQLFSRVHRDDIVAGVVASMIRGPAGAYNLADDLPAGGNAVIEFAARLLGLPPPPFVPLETLSPMARGFFAENRRIANGRARRLLGWRPRYPTYREGLRAILAGGG